MWTIEILMTKDVIKLKNVKMLAPPALLATLVICNA